MNAPRLIRVPEVLSRVGVSRSTLYAMIQRGEFPAGRKLCLGLPSGPTLRSANG
ncbi:AlpA family phage regulatory protein [Oleiagrimonas sp. C23AA]|nr:AlpA family phage regulatory protein [Oleiagrimonas sp. C23AA]